MYDWQLVKDGWPEEEGYYDVTTEPFRGMRVLHERWYFQQSRIKAWEEKDKVIAWRKSLDHRPYEGEK